MASRPGEINLAGYAYSWDSSTVPSYAGRTCLTTAQGTPTGGFVPASGGKAAIPTPSSKGPHTLYVKTLSTTGKVSTDVATYRIHTSSDAFTVLSHEAEALSPGGTATTSTVANALSSQGKRLVASLAEGGTLTLRFTAPNEGMWVIQPVTSVGPDRPVVLYEVDGVPVGAQDPNSGWDGDPVIIPSRYDQHASREESCGEALPARMLDAGAHTLTIRAAKETPSSRTRYTIDQLWLIGQDGN